MVSTMDCAKKEQEQVKGGGGRRGARRAACGCNARDRERRACIVAKPQLAFLRKDGRAWKFSLEREREGDFTSLEQWHHSRRGPRGSAARESPRHRRSPHPSPASAPADEALSPMRSATQGGGGGDKIRHIAPNSGISTATQKGIRSANPRSPSLPPGSGHHSRR